MSGMLLWPPLAIPGQTLRIAVPPVGERGFRPGPRPGRTASMKPERCCEFCNGLGEPPET